MQEVILDEVKLLVRNVVAAIPDKVEGAAETLAQSRPYCSNGNPFSGAQRLGTCHL